MVDFKPILPQAFSSNKIHKAGHRGHLCALIVDESGSMHPYRDDTIGGMNLFIDEQKKDKEKTYLSIFKFEGVEIKTLANNVPIQDIPTITEKDYAPNGSTNLIDAIVFAIDNINKQLGEMREEDRPSVFIQIITDGYENSSRTPVQVGKDMVKEAESQEWGITFIGANIDTIQAGASLGLAATQTMSYDPQNVTHAYANMSSSVSRMKSMRSANVNMADIRAQAWSEEKKEEESK